ncbi:PAS domain-containing protein [Natrialba swarupiae]|uniref:PAS domain-containing protein n=1 Tax=Natrialba swarupiae TaxID=2448032 RepID=UPI001EE4E1EE|nr:PAS domain-containing protein [Natrialba swarupiae]
MTPRSVPIVDRVTDAFFALDTDFRFTYVNDRAETLLKRSRDDLIGRVMWDEFPQTVETQFPDGFHRAMDEQVPVSFEIYHAQLETWFEAQAYPGEDGLSVYMRDVTERKRQETTIAQHAAVVEAVHDGIVTLDRDRRIVTVNAAIEEFLGVERDDLVGEHVEIVPELASIADEDAIEIGRAITDVDIGTAGRRQVEVPFTDADGTDRMGDFRFVPIEDDTATVAVVVRDVTDQHEYERIAASLHEITRWLLESDDPEEICAIAVHAGSDLLDLPISGVWLLEQEHGYLEPVAGTAGAHDEFGGLPRFHPNEGLVWEVFESGSVERFDDLEAVDGLYNRETPIRSEIIAPIGTRGVIMTGSLEADQFDETDVELVSTLAENTRAALDRADREQVLRKRTDELERQTERLEGVANVLSNDLKRQLQVVADELKTDSSSVGLGSESDDGVGASSVDSNATATNSDGDGPESTAGASGDVETVAETSDESGSGSDEWEFPLESETEVDEHEVSASEGDLEAGTVWGSDEEATGDVPEAEATGGGTGTDHEKWEFPLSDDSVEATLDRAERLIDDVREFARNASSVRTRSRIRLDRVIEEAASASRLEASTVFVERAATLRADPDRLIYLLETAFDDIAARTAGDDLTVRVGLTGIDDPDAPRGFYIEDDAADAPPTATDRLLDPTTEYQTAIDGLGLTLVRAIAEAHDWRLSIETAERNGTRIVVDGVMTLEPRA